MKLLLSLLLAVAAVSALPTHEKVDYTNHKVYSISAKTSAQFKTLQALSANFIFFEEPRVLGEKYQVVVPPKFEQQFLERVKSFDYNLDIADLQELIDLEQVPADIENVDDTFWTQYQSLDSIQGWLRGVAAANPGVTKVVEIGKSHENRSILALEINYKPGNKAIFIEGHIHAREWITSATITWIIDKLLHSTEPAVRNLAESVNWYIIPNINPDGFEFTRTTNRLWRKTRTLDTATGCYGTDANRNFPFGWRENGGSSTNPCSETYSGPEPFSEIESVALREYLMTKLDETDVYLSIHSYGQYILYPYGHSATIQAPTDADLFQVAVATAAAMGNRHGTRYTFGQTSTALYIASGCTPDYAYSLKPNNPPLAYTFELRDTGSYGFVLPPEQIIPTAEETLDSLIALHTAALNLGYLVPDN